MKLLLSLALVFASSFALAQTGEIAEPIEEQVETKSNWVPFYQYQHRSLVNSDAGINKDMMPKDIQLRTHLLAIDYRLTDKWSVETGTQYLDMDIEMLGNRMNFNAGSRGLSDTEIGFKHRNKISRSFTEAKFKLSLPTGSIRQKDSVTVDMGPGRSATVERFLPYQGQLGSGTYDLILELDSHRYFTPNLFWRNKIKMEKRTGRNDLGYRLGDEGKLISEMNFPIVGKYLTGMVGGTYKRTSQVVGPNPVIEEVMKSLPFPMELDDPYSEPSERFESYAAIKTGAPLGDAGILAIELGTPLSSSITGNDTGLKTDWYAYVNLISLL